MLEQIPNGRAFTPEQKRQVIQRLFIAWLKAPRLRFGQLIVNAVYQNRGVSDTTRLYNTEDDLLVEDIEFLAQKLLEKTQ